jgi:hypothetical protein
MNEIRKKRIIITGVPRSGTTAIKRLLGSNPGMEIIPFKSITEGLLEIESEYSQDTVKVWKRTRWIEKEHLTRLKELYGDSTHFVLVYRYPRDCYVSLLELNTFRDKKTHTWVKFSDEDSYIKRFEEFYATAIELLKCTSHTFVCYEWFCCKPLDYKKSILLQVGVKSDEVNLYDNKDRSDEDAKCLSQSSINNNSVFKWGRTKKCDEIYERIQNLTR